MKKIAIISTHPIQYNAPWFRILAEKPNYQVKVFYTWSQRQSEFYDHDFGQDIRWDIPLLDGYEFEFVENVSTKPTNKSYSGINCPSLIKSIKNWNATHLLIFGWNFKAHFDSMRYFKGRIPILFRGDSTLLDYDIRSINTLINSFKRSSNSRRNLRFNAAALEQYLKYKIRWIILTYVYRFVDKALYVGSHNRQYFKVHGLKDNQLIFVPHAIDNDRFIGSINDSYSKQAQIWRKQLGFSANDFIFLFAGKFEPRKNPEILIKAFLKAKMEKSNNVDNRIRLLMIGNGPLEAKLRSLSNDKDIVYLPFQNQSVMPIAYRLGDCFCLPSRSETWGLAINEAIASGVPVIVSNKVGCSIDLVKAEYCFTFKSDSLNDLSSTLINASNLDHTKLKPNWNSFIREWSFQKLTENIIQDIL